MRQRLLGVAVVVSIATLVLFLPSLGVNMSSVSSLREPSHVPSLDEREAGGPVRVALTSTHGPEPGGEEGSDSTPGRTVPPVAALVTDRVDEEKLAGIVPFRITESALIAVVNATTQPPLEHNVAPLNEGRFVVPSLIRRFYVEVGTNDEPEMGPLVADDPTAMLLAFEPQPPVFKDMVRRFRPRNRLIPVPGAISPVASFVRMHVSEHRGCSSLLAMNKQAAQFAEVQKKNARTKSVKTQLRTVQFCATLSSDIMVPAAPLSYFLRMVPPSLPIDILSIDAQGFDTHVVSTLGANDQADRVATIVLECQDLPLDHVFFLVDGAPSCAEQRKCVEAGLPHQLEFCWDNAPKVRELNCVYRHPKLPQLPLPPKFKIVGVRKQPVYDVDPKSVFKCPVFLR